MSRFPAFIGLIAGVALIALAIIALPFAVSAREDAPAAATAAYNCPVAQVAMDRGYGLSRTEARGMCSGRNP